jgi:antibiotic biosynthesis monooxygenase (ABM) superfamily enzyme
MSAAEPRWRTAIISWLAVYPTITLVGWATFPLIATLSWPAKTLVLTALMVPLVVYLTGPLARAAFTAAERAIRKNSQPSAIPTRKDPT